MPTITIQAPLDPPKNTFRLLTEIKNNLNSPDFNHFKFITAFAKEGPFIKLKPEIDAWRQSGKLINAIFGVDERGTSRQALAFAISNLDDCFIARISSGTFHPKIYLFEGQNRALAYIGSNNFTTGGLETNAESLIRLDLSIPADQTILDEVRRCWVETMSVCLPLDPTLLANLTARAIVIDETQMRAQRAASMTVPVISGAPVVVFPRIQVVPASPIPRTVSTPTVISSSAPPRQTLNATNVTSLVIQVIPHDNGEIFLSKNAVNQNNAFFRFPFSGSTTPKKATNASYPQRVPDPVVDITIFDQHGRQINYLAAYSLNTVYYTTKSDIRITVAPSLAQSIPPLSILVMRETTGSPLDYDIEVYYPGSTMYASYLAVCNQTMPSGGGSVGRKFGWI